MYTIGRCFTLGSLCINVTFYHYEVGTRNMVEVEGTQKLSKHKIVPCRCDVLRFWNNAVTWSVSVMWCSCAVIDFVHVICFLNI